MDKTETPKTPFWQDKKVVITVIAVSSAALVGLVVKNTVDLYNLNAAVGSNVETIGIILDKMSDKK